VEGSKRVPPDMWLEYRRKYKFEGLRCLCPLLQTTDDEPPLTEANILVKDSGDHMGEYVAECPNGRCEYLGQLPIAFQYKESLMRWKKKVSLEQRYALYGIPVKSHALRGRLFRRKASRHVR
jgi:hypothetical protein